MKKYRECLYQQERKLSPGLLEKYGLLCKQLPFVDDSEVLYVAKPHWTNRFDPKREYSIGIFCAIWVSPELLEQQQFAYNIHSLKLRQLQGFKLTSRKFADEFRSAVKASVASWPNVRMDYGPMTLLEGRCECSIDSFSKLVEERVNGFVSIHHEIDKLLDASKS